MKHETTLVIGDAHADPNFSNERFDALGRFIVDRRPDNIVQIGDWGNLDSISFHNHGRPLLQEGQRLALDLDAMRDAYERVMTPLWTEWERARKSKRKRYDPKRYWVEGNHEDRVRRFLEGNPVLEGFVPESDLVGAEPDGWEVVPYREYVFINGTGFTHVPINDAHQPVSGKYMAMRAAERHAGTIVFGHNHRRELLSVNRVTEGTTHGTRVDALSAGCFFDYDPEYVRGGLGNLAWWRGLVLLTHVGYSRVDIETISIDRVKEQYL